MPSLYEQIGHEIMYRANLSLAPIDVGHFKDNLKPVLGSYFNDLHLGRKENNNLINRDFYKRDSLDFLRQQEKGQYTLGSDILYRTALNPSKN